MGDDNESNNTLWIAVIVALVIAILFANYFGVFTPKDEKGIHSVEKPNLNLELPHNSTPIPTPTPGPLPTPIPSPNPK
jgi:hypothetical protein